MRGDQDYVLSFGSLDFSPLAQGGAFRYFVTGLTRGRPSPVITTITSLLQNGSLEQISRYDNRDQSLVIGVEADDPAALSAGEAALFLEAQKGRNLLSWRPPGGAGVATVFEILWASLEPSDAEDWDLSELRGERFYTLTMRALPFARSAVERTVSASPVATAPTVLDPGTSAANWSTSTFGASVGVGTFAGRSAVQFSGATSGYEVVYNGAAPTQAYLSLIVANGAALTLQRPDGSSQLPAATEPVAGGFAYRRFWFSRPAGLTSPLRFAVSNPTATTGSPASVYVGGLEQAPGLGASSLLAINVEGSAPASGRIALTRAAVMSWATVFTDPAMAGGAYHPAMQATWANAPAGTYAFWMEPRVGSVVEVTITDAQGAAQTETLRNTGGISTHMPVGEFTFGGRADGKVGPLTVSVKIDGATSTAPTAPRLYRKARETALNCILLSSSSASGANKIEIQAPSVAYPNGALFADSAPVGRRFVSWEDPLVAPPTTYMFVEGNNSSADPIAATFSYFPAWHTNAAA